MSKISVRRRFVYLILVILVIVPTVASAVLPAVVFAEFAAAAVESIVIRSVARSTIATIGTAANDASWVSTFNGWLTAGRAVGALVVNQLQDASGVPATYEIQLASPTADLTTAANASVYRMTTGMATLHALDGLAHYPPSTVTGNDVVAAGDAYIVWFNSLAKTQYIIQRKGDYIGACGEIDPDIWCNFDQPNDNYNGLTADGIIVVEEGKDGIKRVLRTATSWSYDTTDPDWLASEKTELTGVSAIRFVGDVAGRVAAVDVYAATTGYGVQYQEQLTSSTVRQLASALDTAAIPVSSQQFNGEGAFVLPAYDTAAGGSASVSVQFPSDYARTGEAASATAPMVTIMSSTGSVADPTEPLGADMPGWGSTFDNLTGWTVPAHVSVCPQPSMDLSNILGAGSVYTMSAHCDLFAQHAATFQAVMMVVWSILALFLVLGA